MARYKHIDTNPRLPPVDLARQLLPGTFEHAVSHLVDHEIDLSHFDDRYRNDETGASAYPPAMLLKVVLRAYAHGIVSSRAIERVCQEHVTFIALSGEESLITADAGYHSEANLRELSAMGIDALIADNDMRRRDERFATQGRHREAKDPLHDKGAPSKRKLEIYQPSDFTYDAEARTCVCPAGKSLYRSGKNLVTKGHVADHFRGAKRDCLPCAHRARCLRTLETTATHQVAFFHGRAGDARESHTDRMKRRLDSPEDRSRYGKRFGAVEPVFGNLRYNKGLRRFTLRGRKKVDGQWKLYNIEKLACLRYAA